jgi:cell division protease FtsH
MRLPENDRFTSSRIKLKADLAVAMGGRVAEEVIFGYDKVTSGASGDIQQATKLATYMVTELGMSDKVGPLFYGSNPQDNYAHHQSKTKSEEVANLIDHEIKILVEEGYNKAKEIITSNLEVLHNLAKALLEYETITGDEIRGIVAGKPIVRVVESATNTKPSKSSFAD